MAPDSAAIADRIVDASETVIGRATWRGRLAVLTSKPALILLDPSTRRSTRLAIRAGAAPGLELWGLGEADGDLFTVSRFVDLLKIAPDGTAAPAARLRRPIANLFDLETGMAGQFAHDAAGRPLAWGVAADGTLSALDGPPRAALKISNVEAGVAHLLSCSAPPRVTCWLPGSAQPLRVDQRGLRAGAPLEGLTSVMPTWVTSGSAPQVIEDAVVDERGRLVVTHRIAGPSGDQRVTLFDEAGRALLTRTPPERLRCLLAASSAAVLAIGISGKLVEVRL